MLKVFRKRRQLTQQQLAEMIGMHRSAIVRWEQGDFLPESKTMVLELARHLRLDEQESRHLLEASLTALSPYWHVPFQRNPFFTGREEILEALHAQLDIDQPLALTHASALHGLGGMGKTQIALEYAYRYALEYSAVFWIEAETGESIISSLVRIAEALQVSERHEADPQRIVAVVQRWLGTHSRWLLIWDNLDDLALLPRFLPSARQGAFLLTTRTPVLGTLAQGIPLSPMEQEEALLLLLRRAKVLEPAATREHLAQFALRSPTGYAAAVELATVLDGMPLALDQAGAYLEETGCSLDGYCRLYQQQRAYLLARRGSVGGDHPHSVAATFRLSSERVGREEQAAADLLRVCALLDAEAIPERLFVTGALHLGPELARLASDPARFDEAIAILRRLSLVSRQPEIQTLTLHRLVQAVLCESMDGQEQAMWLQRVIAALNLAFPEEMCSSEYASWKQGSSCCPTCCYACGRPDLARNPSPWLP
jgi:transcriptional regulator with XRE-family HTH domain